MTEKRKPPAGHGWKPGQSGNPKGRAPGSGQVQMLRAALGEHLDEVLEVVVAQAQAGDMQACRLILDRVLPALRPAEQPVALEMPKDGTLTQQAQAVLTAAADGSLGPGQAAQLVSAIAAVGKVAELDEMNRRIEALEAKYGKP